MKGTTARVCLAILVLLASLATGTIQTSSADACYICSLEEQQRCNRYCQSRGALYGECRLCTDTCFCTY